MRRKLTVLLGNARCKKDNAKTIYNTFGTILGDDLLQIQNGGGLSICSHNECHVLAINSQDDTSRTIITIELFCTSGIFCTLLL